MLMLSIKNYFVSIIVRGETFNLCGQNLTFSVRSGRNDEVKLQSHDVLVYNLTIVKQFLIKT